MGCIPSTHCHRLRRENDALRVQLTALRVQLKDARVQTTLDRAYECKICFDRPIEAVLLPCGHTLACRACVDVLDACPVCLVAVDSVTHIMMQ